MIGTATVKPTVKRHGSASYPRSALRHMIAGAGALAVLVAMTGSPAGAAAQVGQRAHSFDGFGVEASGGAVTGEKPESKLWHHDGKWWAAMVSPARAGAHTVHRLQGTTWTDTETVIDERPSSKEDVLSDGNTLFIVSRVTRAVGSAKLRRFTYINGSYRIDNGFPVDVPGNLGETLTIAKDSTGVLWLAYDRSGKIYVARSLDTHTRWGAPFVLPVAGASTAGSDDIAAVIAFRDAVGPAIGVMWSNQNEHRQYFAVHRDGQPDNAWTREEALSGDLEADDHINLKTHDGQIYAAVKTSQPSAAASQPLIRLLNRNATGSWRAHPVARVDEKNTRPITVLQLDTAANEIYVFMTVGRAKGISYKKSSMTGIGFPAQATMAIQGPNGEAINNVTSTKQNATSASGITIMAADPTHYWWNRLGGGTSTPAPAPVASFTASPDRGVAPLAVQFTDTSTDEPTSWDWSFGNAQTSTQRNPSVTYQTAGSYTVTLTARNAGGSSTATRTVTVDAPLPGGGGGETLAFTATDDAHIRRANPTKVLGGQATLDNRTTSSDEWRSYVRFDVTGLSGPASAKLRMYVTIRGDGVAVHSLPSTSWSERTLTWNNAPQPGGQVATAPQGAAGTWVEIDLPPLSGNGTYSWAMTNTGKRTTYSSKEGGNAPQLVVTPGR